MSAPHLYPAPLPNDPEPDQPGRRAAQFVDKFPVSHDGLAIDPNRPLQARSEILNKILGTEALVVAAIHAGKNGKFAIIDGRDVARFGAPFLLLNASNPNQIKTIQPDTSLTVGRQHFADQFDYPKDVSRSHFSLGYDSEEDKLHIRDEHSQNGTFVTGHVHLPENVALARHREKIDANFTRIITSHMANEEDYAERDQEAPHGYFRGHPVIGRHSRSVRNGIYGTSHSEQLVVDSEAPYVSNIVSIAIHELHKFARNPSVTQRDMLRFIRDQVSLMMNYDLAAVERISSPHYESRGLINMSDYLKAGVGVCRHQAILAALIMEQAIDEGLLQGSIGVQRNHDLELRGAHAWAVFRDQQNHTIIVDPAQDYVGTREEAKDQPGRWKYYVPDTSE